MIAPICPADKAHGEMVDLFDSDLYYCYECKWIKESYRKLERVMGGAMTIKKWLQKSRVQLIVNKCVVSPCGSAGHCPQHKPCCYCVEADKVRDQAYSMLMAQYK